MTSNDAYQRPREVRLAVIIFCISIVIGFLCSLTDIQDPVLLSGNLIGSLITAFFVYKIYQGRNWVRIVFSVLSIFGLLIQAGLLLQMVSVRSIDYMSLALQIPITFIGVFLLFTESSSNWFASEKSDQG